MRTGWLVFLVVAFACKEAKQEAKPAPSPAPAPAPKPEAPKPEPTKADEISKPAIKPAGGINTSAEYEAKAFDLTEKLTAVFAASGTNCDKLANNLEAFLETNKDALSATDLFEGANPSAEDDLEPKLQQKAKTLIEKWNFSMKACGKHEGVKAALAKLPD